MEWLVIAAVVGGIVLAKSHQVRFWRAVAPGARPHVDGLRNGLLGDRIWRQRQQVRDGDKSQKLLRQLLLDFTLEVMRQSVEGGRYAFVAEYPPGELLRRSFGHTTNRTPVRSIVRVFPRCFSPR